METFLVYHVVMTCFSLWMNWPNKQFPKISDLIEIWIWIQLSVSLVLLCKFTDFKLSEIGLCCHMKKTKKSMLFVSLNFVNNKYISNMLMIFLFRGGGIASKDI